MRLLSVALASGMVVLSAAQAGAFLMQTRVVERIGNTDVPLGASVQFTAGTTHRLRIQFGLFDDASGAAPPGGFVAWNAGTINTTGNGTWTRTPGRLQPFFFAPQSTANGVPLADPFTSLTQIDFAIGQQNIPWNCDGGQPLPVPGPLIRGRNEFISVFEVSVAIPGTTPPSYQFDYAGHFVGIQRWDYHPEFGMPPDCDTGSPGTAVYLPFATAQTQGNFTQSLRIDIVVPAPASVVGIVGVLLAGVRRRRRYA